MFSIHFPVVEILHLVMKLRNNQVFLRISRILILSLVALSALGHAGEWAKGLDPSSPGCTIPKWGCYSGLPLNMMDAVFKLGMSGLLFLLPLIDLFSACLLLFRPSRTYLTLLALSIIGSFLQMFASNPVSSVNFLSGSGFCLSLIAFLFLFLLNMPLAFVEQMRLHPDWEYRKYLPWYMAS